MEARKGAPTKLPADPRRFVMNCNQLVVRFGVTSTLRPCRLTAAWVELEALCSSHMQKFDASRAQQIDTTSTARATRCTLSADLPTRDELRLRAWEWVLLAP
jgi:hypothetical protein